MKMSSCQESVILETAQLEDQIDIVTITRRCWASTPNTQNRDSCMQRLRAVRQYGPEQS